MKHTLSKTLVVGGGLLAALALGTSTAAAATTYTVSAGSAASGAKVAVKGTTTGGSPQITFTDATSGTVLTCTSGTAPGSVTVGKGRSGTAIATITGASTTWTNCTGPLGLSFKVTGSGTWTLNATSGTSAGASGTITGIKATVNGGSDCSFPVSGSVAAKYTNSTTALSVPGTAATLKIGTVTGGCFGLVNTGDVASFKATYKIAATTAAYNPVKITAP